MTGELNSAWPEHNDTGVLHFNVVREKTTASTKFSTYPLKFIFPSKLAATASDCCWVYIIGYGGGILSGDHVSISCVLDSGSTVALTTQASTKVFKHSGSDAAYCSQRLTCSVATGAVLAVIPDHVTCFADARYKQCQEFLLAPGGNLVLCDWCTSGRMERGEAWQFTSFESRNSIRVGKELVVLDALLLQAAHVTSIAERMRGMHVVGMVVLLGPKLENIVASMLEQERAQRQTFSSMRDGNSAKRVKQLPIPERSTHTSSGTDKGAIMTSCSAIEGHSGAIFRFACERTADAYKLLHELLAPLEPLLGAKPFSNDSY